MHSAQHNSNRTSIETAGEFFSGGTSLELFSDSKTGRLCLMFTSGQTCRVAPRIEYGGRTYVPINLDDRLLRAVRFPTQTSDYVSTKELFNTLRQVFMEYGFSEEVGQIGAHFVFSTWFLDCLPAAPCLLINGPKPEAELCFQLLACLARHSLQLADFNSKSISSLIKIQPTLLIRQEFLSHSKLRLLLASNDPNTYFPLGDGLVCLYSAKAVYSGVSSCEDSFGKTMLRLNLSPIRGKLPILDAKIQNGIGWKFQSKLVNYRVRNIEKVLDSTFDFPWLTSGVRILARILGACIIDAAEVQADLAPFFERQQRAIREHNWVDTRCVAIEVGLAFCHSAQAENRIFVGQFADDVNIILKGRGHAALHAPKEIGMILRSLGFSPNRGSKGYGFRLTDEIRKHIHKLAFEFDLRTLLDVKSRCPHCKEVLKLHMNGKSRR